MFGTSPFFSERDKNVRVLADGTVVSASLAQSEYARALNFIGDRFTATSNTVGGVKTYDIALKYADKIIPYEGGVAKGTTPGFLNFDGNHFDVSSLASSQYTVTSTGWVKVNALAVAPLNIVNATNNEAVMVASGTNITNLTFNNDETDVYSNGVKITAAPRSPNFIGFSVADDATNDRVDITGNFLPNPFYKKFGLMYGPQNTSSPSGVMAGQGLLNIPYTTIGGGNAISGGYDATHGVFRRYTLGSDDNDAFKILSGADITNRAANPHIYGKMRIQTLQDYRFFIGFHTGTIPDNDNDFLNNLEGFALTAQRDTTPDTTWQIKRNSGTATTTAVSSGVSIAAVTPVFTFELVADNANARWGWNVNGGAFTYYNTLVPTTSNLRFTYQLEEIGGSEAEIDIFYLYWLQDL